MEVPADHLSNLSRKFRNLYVEKVLPSSCATWFKVTSASRQTGPLLEIESRKVVARGEREEKEGEFFNG